MSRSKREPKKLQWMTDANQEMWDSNGMGQNYYVEKGNEARHHLLVGGGSTGGGILRIKSSLSANPQVGCELLSSNVKSIGCIGHGHAQSCNLGCQ
jgi:hypothetical protein